jgi:hypothetical protein
MFGIGRMARIAYQHDREITMVLAMSLPDRLSTNPKSPFYDEALLEAGVGIKFNGAEKTNVEEYCISEGWIRVVAGKSVDRHGNPMTIKLKGKVEPYLKETSE